MTKLKEKLVRWLEDNRGLVIVLFCLPASFLFNSFFKLRNWVHRKFLSAPADHDQRVKAIQKKVREWNDLPVEGRPRMCTARPNWLSLSTTFFRKDGCYQVPVSLYDILSWDEEKNTIRVEPMVTVGEITKFLIPRRYTLAVTLEIADATCGGLALAVGMTTYSHRVGLYQETVESYDVVLADGSLVHVTRDNEYSDLFQCLPWSHGTLGFLVALELKIVPVKPYIHMKYISVKGQKAYCDKMRELSGATDSSADLPDYLEATVFSRDEAVIMVGNFADVNTVDKVMKVNNVSRWYKPWFYTHVKSFLNKDDCEEYIPLRQYLLRHNRAIFWVLESMIPFGNNPLFRFFLGWLCPPKPAFLKFTTTPPQVFVFCWVDKYRNNSEIQVINAATIGGVHFAEHIRPMVEKSQPAYDRSVYEFYVPLETAHNPTNRFGFVIHKDEPKIFKLDFSTLNYIQAVNLTPYECMPVRLNYLPIGGLLHVTCASNSDEKVLHTVTIDVETDAVVDFEEESGMSKEYFSSDYDFAIRLFPSQDTITLYNVSDSGKMQKFMVIRTNFVVADVYFARKKYNPNAMVVYMLAKNQGAIMIVDLQKKRVELMDGLTLPTMESTLPWINRTRRLAPSGWFGWFLASAGRSGMEIIGLNSNQVLCRMNDFVHATSISWSSGHF